MVAPFRFRRFEDISVGERFSRHLYDSMLAACVMCVTGDEDQDATWIRSVVALLRRSTGRFEDPFFQVRKCYRDKYGREPAPRALIYYAVLASKTARTEDPTDRMSKLMLDPVVFLFGSRQEIRELVAAERVRELMES